MSDKNQEDENVNNLNESIENSEIDPQFTPVITLPEIEVITNEENEDLVVKLRAKLYRFVSVDGEQEWKERGTGEIKILKDPVNKTARIVMRRDKTLKVCANHFIKPWMELKPNCANEKSFVYFVSADFADEISKTECLAIRFATVDIAAQFKQKFEEVKEFVGTECRKNSTSDLSDIKTSQSGDKTIENNDTDKVSKKLLELNLTKCE